MRRVLITGASGFIGRSLIQALEGGDWKIEIFSFRRFLMDSDYEMPSVDCVIHLAALVHQMDSKETPHESEYIRINVEGVKKLAIASKKAGCKRFIFISSVKAIGEFTPDGQAFNAQSECSPKDSYGLSKLRAENLLLQIAAKIDLEVVILRLPLVYGPNVKGNLLTLARFIRAGIPLPLAAATNKRSLVSVGNLVDVIQICMVHPAAKNELFLVSDDDDISTVQLINNLGDAILKPARLFWMPVWLVKFIATLAGRRAMFDRLFTNLELDVDKTKQYLEWNPRLKFSEAIRMVRISND